MAGVVGRSGRPMEYDQDTVDKALDYVENYKEKYGHPFPSNVGLAKVLNRGMNTIYLWRKDERKPEFRDIMDRIKEVQEMELLHNGVTGVFNSTIASLVLGKHGYHKKVDSTLSGPDGTPIQTVSKTLQVVGVDSEHPDSKQAS